MTTAAPTRREEIIKLSQAIETARERLAKTRATAARQEAYLSSLCTSLDKLLAAEPAI